MKRLLMFVLLVVVLMAGCSSILSHSGTAITATARCADPQSMELIIGAHRNAPQPALDQGLVCQATAAIRAGKPVQIVAASGEPLLITLTLASVSGGTLAQQNSPRVQQDVQRVQAAIAAARPGFCAEAPVSQKL